MNKNKDANLDIEAPETIEMEFPHEHATVKTGRLNKCPDKGKPDKGSYLVNIEKHSIDSITIITNKTEEEFFIKIDKKLLEQLDWKENNKLCLSTTLNCFDWGKVDSLVLRNLSKEIDG